MSDLSNYSNSVLLRTIESIRAIPRPHPGPIHNLEESTLAALKTRAAKEIAQLSPEQIVRAVELLRASTALLAADERAQRHLGRIND